ncbi:MAG: ATP-dependent chaperone ClpB, partial [Planctomycetaceae bacterium]
RPGVMDVVRRAFRPEFLNRLDEILLFRRLSRQHMTGIVEIQLRRLVTQAAKAGITLDFTAATVDEVARLGYDPVYGARPLKRVIQQQLQNALARELLSGAFPEGSAVRIDFLQDGFTFTKAA